MIGGVILVVVLILVALYFSYYNRIRTYENQIDEAWAQIDVQLKKRFDLVPNLVETVKGYASHEKEIFENVAKARAGLMG
ncbi:LemA family protein, partial [Candidatus Bathyarchaeota archaeon]|nr:LemA family protein [Candidatus Bathyarchaeota archaeon]